MDKENHLSKVALNRAEQYSDKVLLQIKRNNRLEQFTGGKCAELYQAVAKALLYEGVQRQDKIGIYSQNMPEWTLADIGIMCTGAISVPIYATNTAQQAAYIIEDAGIEFLFVGEEEQYQKALELLEKESCRLKKVIVFDSKVALRNERSVYFHDFVNEFDKASVEKLERCLKTNSDKDIATIIYTSGTTGEPKGVVLGHDTFVQAIKIHDQKFDITSEDESLCFLPLSHVFERAWTIYVLHKGMLNSYLSDPTKIAEYVKEIKPTVMCSVPRLYEKIYHMVYGKLQEASWLKKKMFNWAIKIGKKEMSFRQQGRSIPFPLKVKHSICDSLIFSKLRNALGGRHRFMPCAGAPLSKEITDFFHAVGLYVVVGYGLTETCATVTAFDQAKYKTGTVGVPMPEVEVKIGPDQEIWVKAKTLMRGYYKKPEATKKVFEGDWFKTGDAGKFDTDGNLIITDRIKDLIKTSGGKYVAPQKLEALLTDDSFIEQAVIIGDQRHFISALIVPSFEALYSYAKENKIAFKNRDQLICNTRILNFYNDKINALQKELARYETIKKFTLIAREFTMERGELTPTLKIRRKVITERMQPSIDAMYL